jgi:metallophosphoesterase (TIGR03767 family)
MNAVLRTDLGGTPATSAGQPLLSLVQVSDAHVIDTVSPARCEWIELLANEELWKPLLHMHRPYEALTHWALAAHIDRLRDNPYGPHTHRPYDLLLSTGDNIDNAQANELDTFLTILAGGTTRLSAYGGVHDPSKELGSGPWPFWSPDRAIDCTWKPQGYPVIDNFLERVSAPLQSDGLGFAWASLPGNHDVMRQGTALPNAAIERIAVGSNKILRCPPGFAPQDPLSLFVSHPELFSAGATRQIAPDPKRSAVDLRAWLQAHVDKGAAGYSADHVQRACADTVIDTEHVRLILLDTNHPGGDYQGSVGAAQLAWLDARLAEADAIPGRLAVLASHHGSASLINTRGDDPERLLADALVQVAHRHSSVVAWLVGHRHLHRVVAHTPLQSGQGGHSGFWEITTASVIDWPSQLRAIEIVRHTDGTVEIACNLLDHHAAPDSLAALHLGLSRRFAGAGAGHMQGEPGDGNVRLLWPRRI